MGFPKRHGFGPCRAAERAPQLRYVPGKGYVVEDDAGRRLSGILRLKDEAETLRQAHLAAHAARVKRGPRDCLTCRLPFESEGKHNRMCPACRQRGGAVALPALAGPAALIGRGG